MDAITSLPGWIHGAAGTMMTGAIVSALLMLIAKKWPKEKLLKMTEGKVEALGKSFDVLLGRWLGEKTAEKLEEGLLPTIGYVLAGWGEAWKRGMAHDARR